MATLYQNQNVAGCLSRKHEAQKWELGILWGLLHLCLAFLVLLDISSGWISRYLLSLSPIFWFLESGLVVVFFLNAAYDIVSYFRVRWASPLEVSKSQQNLFGINLNRDRGFVDSSPKLPVTPARKLSPHFPSNSFLISSTPRASPSALWSSTHSSSSLPFNVVETSMASTGTSWDYCDGDGLKNKSALFKISPLKIGDVIADDTSLNRFLQSERVGDELTSVSKDNSFGNTSSSGIWNQTSSQHTISPVRMRYQLSSKSPKTSSSSTESESLNSQNGLLIWSKIGVSPDRLVNWIENLRKWISKTINSRLVAEILSVNELLRWQGTPDLQIGEASLNALKLRTKGQNISSLMTLLHYLDVTSNQEYLVQRLKDLEKGRCMSEFRWNSGGEYKGKPWAEHLPTDSAIIMHLFFTYLDTNAPPSYSFPEGRAVTSKHFIQSLDKLDLTSKDTLCIYQSSVNPPHYQLVVGETVYELQKGRNNMFSAMLLFLYHIKMNEDGMLKRINLGPSGLNILWVLSD